ncbi:hypothetical protein C0989_006975, partial [Termitomyces sp. Mn162]
MLAASPSAKLAACALAYMRSPPRTQRLAGGIFKIGVDKQLLKEIVASYKKDIFAQQVHEEIKKGSIAGAKLENGLL